MANKLTANEFLGERLVEKYQYIYPIVRLILYRIDTWGRGGLSPYDGKNPDDKLDICRKMLGWSGKILYYFNRLRYKESSDSKIVLSETIFKIGRYRDMNNEIYQSGKIYRFCSEANCSVRSIFIDQKNGFRWKLVTPIYISDSISGKNLKRAAYAVFDLFEALLKEDMLCKEEEEKVDLFLEKLQCAVAERVDFLCKIIEEKNVKGFVTFNPYSLNDYVFMLACKKMNVKTKLYFHYGLAHAPKIADSHYEGAKFIDDGISWNIHDEAFFWTKADMLSWEKYEKQENFFGEKLKLEVIGCPEVTKSLLYSYQKKYPKTNIVTVSAPMSDMFSDKFDIARMTYNDSDIDGLREWKRNIYYQFYKMACKNKVKVCVRYHPSEPAIFRKLDKEILEEYGFCVSEDTRDGLFRSVSESIATFGHSTSFSVISYIFGAKTVLLNLDNSNYDLCGYNMDVIRIEDISEYIIENDNVAHPDECFDLEKFLRVLS